MDVTYQYMKKRAAMGRQPLFCEKGPELCDSVVVNVKEQKQFILRNPVHTAVQHGPVFSRHTVNTIRAEYSTSGANHAEGGWPRDVNVNDPEATQRYRRKIEKDDGYIHCVMSLAPGMEHYVLQNNVIDMYQTYYTELEAAPEVQHTDCRTVNVLRDPCTGLKRPVSSICWEPDEGERLTATYVKVDFDRRPRASCDAYLWNLNYPLAPEATMTAPAPLLDLQFNQRNPQMLAGALMSGCVCGYDRRAGPGPAWACPPHVAHRDYVKNVLFINSKSGMEFFSAGAEGVVKWWDARNLEEPTEELILDLVQLANDEPVITNANGVSVLEFEPTIPTRFMVGTENGIVLAGNRKGKTHRDKLPGRFDAQVGPVRALQRNPSFLKNFLTVGDWTARVWSEDCRESAVLMTRPLRNKITDGVWSPTKVSLMVLTHDNGRLSFWDLLRRTHEPVLLANISDSPLSRVRLHEKGKLVAAGGDNGYVYLLELSGSLVDSNKNDKALMSAMLERESKRERILEARMREIRLKQRQAEEGSPVASATDLDATIGDRDLVEAATQFTAIVKKEFSML